jgi:hypothetical protein
LSAYSYSNPSIVAGSSMIHASDITETRQALAEVYVAAGLVVPSYSAVPAAGTMIRASDIMELRAAIVAIE